MHQVICMKWGTLYGAEYVNRLYAMVRHRTSGPLRFVCLTDDPQGVRDEVECLPCPTVGLPEPYCRTGWRKLVLWADSKDLFGLEGDWLFLDLDVVLTGPLDDFFSYRPDERFVVMQNWTQPGKGIGNTSVFRFRVGCAPFLLERMLSDFPRVLREYRIEQTFISREIGAFAFWPDAWCQLFKVQCVPPWPQRFWRSPIIPEGCRVVAFPGSPNPHEAVRGEWPVRKWYKRLYKHTEPALWIDQIWDEAESAVAGRV